MRFMFMYGSRSGPAAAQTIPIGRYMDLRVRRRAGMDKYRNNSPGSSRLNTASVTSADGGGKGATSQCVIPSAVIASCMPMNRRKVGKTPGSNSLIGFMLGSYHRLILL